MGGVEPLLKVWIDRDCTLYASAFGNIFLSPEIFDDLSEALCANEGAVLCIVIDWLRDQVQLDSKADIERASFIFKSISSLTHDRIKEGLVRLGFSQLVESLLIEESIPIPLRKNVLACVDIIAFAKRSNDFVVRLFDTLKNLSPLKEERMTCLLKVISSVIQKDKECWQSDFLPIVTNLLSQRIALPSVLELLSNAIECLKDLEPQAILNLKELLLSVVEIDSSSLSLIVNFFNFSL